MPFLRMTLLRHLFASACIARAMRFLWCAVACLAGGVAAAQRMEPYTWDDFVTRYAELRAEDDTDEADDEEWLTELSLLHENPIDLNNSQLEQLLHIPTITAAAAEQIHAYIYQNGAIQTAGELRLVPGLTSEMLRVLPLFVRLGGSSTVWSRPYKPKWQGSVDYRFDVPLYYRKGYCTEPGYAGDPLYHRLRAHVRRGRLELGVRMEKDPGETYPDSYGGYVMLDHDQKSGTRHTLRRLIVGDYRATFGQGLVVGSGIQWGTAIVAPQPTQGLRPMRGSDEYDYLRGAGTALQWSSARLGDFALTACASWRQLDATLDEEGDVLTTRRDGLHRTQSERSAAAAYHSVATAIDLGWTYRQLELGLTGAWEMSSRRLSPGEEIYRQIYPQGSQFAQVGAHYALPIHTLLLAGEVAYSTARGGWATLHRICYVPNRRLQLALAPWHYSYRYHSPLASALVAAGSTPQNETGATLNIDAQLFNGLRLTAMAQAAHHPWPRYGMSVPDNQYRAMAELELKPLRKHRLAICYRWQRGLERGDHLRTHHHTRVQWVWTPTKVHNLRAAVLTHTVEGQTGWAATLRWALETPNERWNATTGLTYHHTPDYLRRIWIYEPALLGSAANGNCQGHGVRGVCKVRHTLPSRHWQLEAKLGITYYLDGDTHGSGLQAIDGRYKADVGLLARFLL